MDIGLIILMIAFIGVCLFVIYDNRTRYSRKSLDKNIEIVNTKDIDPISENPYSSDLINTITTNDNNPIVKVQNQGESSVFSEESDTSSSEQIPNYYDESNDSALISSYIDGDERLLEVLLNRHKKRIYNFIYSKVLDRGIAEDIFQDAIIKSISLIELGDYKKESRFLPWVMRISHNLVINHFRKGNRMPTFKNTDKFDIFSVLSDSSLNAEKEIIQNQIHFDIRKIVNELPDDQKEVLIMRIYKNMSFKEISENTGVSINIVLGRMRYALINLRNIMKEKQIGVK